MYSDLSRTLSVYMFFLTSVVYKLCPQPTSTSVVDLLKAEPKMIPITN
jgi:hypothetical protein